MAEENIITLDPKRIKRMIDKAEERRRVSGSQEDGQVVGEITGCVPTMEEAEEIAKEGGSIIARGDKHSVGVRFPPRKESD